jgi:uncharacterized protein (DUF2267 family)
MTELGLSQFDETVHLTNTWLKELMHDLGTHDRHRAYRALRAVLHALRDRLPVEAAAHLAAQLPMLVRGFYYEGWRPAGPRGKEQTIEEFVDRVKRELANDPQINAEEATRAVFRLIDRHVSEGEMRDIRGNLPSAICSLWRKDPWIEVV